MQSKSIQGLPSSQSSGSVHSKGYIGAVGEDQLTPTELKIVELHITGMSEREIGQALRMSQQGIGKTLQRRRVVEKIRRSLDDISKEADERLKGHLLTAVDRIGPELRNPDSRIALQAANLNLKACAMYTAKPKDNRASAEEVIREFMMGGENETDENETTCLDAPDEKADG